MKSKTFFDMGHASRYLKQSIITYNNRPIYVYDIRATKNSEHGYGIHATYVPTPEVGRMIPIEDKMLDFTPVQLGLMNIHTTSHGHEFFETFEVSRVPVRHWVIGLTYKNIRVSSTYGGLEYIGPPDLLAANELANTILGYYPTYAEAYKTLKDFDGPGSIAFCRKFAIRKKDKNMLLIAAKHNTTSVGVCKLSGPTLSPKFFFLRELLATALEK